MKELKDLGINLIAAFIGFLLNSVWGYIRKFRKAREPMLKLLGMDFDKDVFLFCTNVQTNSTSLNIPSTTTAKI